MQQLVLLGTFFVLPVYLQIVLGFDAFETGTKLVPMSVTMLIAALTGPRLAARLSPKRVVQAGLLALALGTVIVLSTIDVQLEGYGFAVGLAVFGVGAGLMASQLGNVIMSSAPAAQTNEAGGLQGTAQNLGASLGTALIGAVLITGLTNGFVDNVSTDPTLPDDLRLAVIDYAESNGLEVIPVAELETQLTEAGLAAADVTALVDAYSAAQLDGLRVALGAVAVFAVLGLWFTRRLPESAAALAEAGAAAAPG
jgi:Na+/melibiose symporter-like transporter